MAVRLRAIALKWALLLVFLSAACCRARRIAAPSALIDEFITKAVDRARAPGLSLAILQRGRIASIRNFGVMNGALKDPVSEQTVFEACSLSKQAGSANDTYTHFSFVMASLDRNTRGDQLPPVGKLRA